MAAEEEAAAAAGGGSGRGQQQEAAEEEEVARREESVADERLSQRMLSHQRGWQGSPEGSEGHRMQQARSKLPIVAIRWGGTQVRVCLYIACGVCVCVYVCVLCVCSSLRVTGCSRAGASCPSWPSGGVDLSFAHAMRVCCVCVRVVCEYYVRVRVPFPLASSPFLSNPLSSSPYSPSSPPLLHQGGSAGGSGAGRCSGGLRRHRLRQDDPGMHLRSRRISPSSIFLTTSPPLLSSPLIFLSILLSVGV